MPKPLSPALVASLIADYLDGEYHDGEEVFVDAHEATTPNRVIVTVGREDEEDLKFRVDVERV